MIVTVNYERQIRDAFNAGAAAALLHKQMKNFPKPDADAYIRSLEKKNPVPKF